MQRTEMHGKGNAPGLGAQGVVAAGPRAPHGGITPAELELAGRAREQVLDLSVCVNPFGPPGEVFRAVREATLTDYPDPECRLARRRIADQQGVRPEQIALGHGASELLWTLARSLIRPGTRVLLVEPAFGEFGAAAYASGAQIDVLRCIEQRNFDLLWAELGERINRWAPQVVSLTGPSSPAGRHLSLVGLADIALSFPATWFILDQSYLGLSEFSDDLDIALPPNVVALRSLTKELGIPAVRVGYCIAPEPLIRQLEMQRPAWTVSTATQCAAAAAMRSREQIKEHRQRLLFLRQQLSRGLNELGLTTLESCTHFFLARLPQPGPVRDVGELRYQLLTRHGVLVRDCSSFGLVGWFRVSAHPEQDTLLTALRNMGLRPEPNTAGQAIGARNPSTAPSVAPVAHSAELGNLGGVRNPFGAPQPLAASQANPGFGGSMLIGGTAPPDPSQRPQDAGQGNRPSSDVEQFAAAYGQLYSAPDPLHQGSVPYGAPSSFERPSTKGAEPLQNPPEISHPAYGASYNEQAPGADAYGFSGRALDAGSSIALVEPNQAPAVGTPSLEGIAFGAVLAAQEHPTQGATDADTPNVVSSYEPVTADATPGGLSGSLCDRLPESVASVEAMPLAHSQDEAPREMVAPASLTGSTHPAGSVNEAAAEEELAFAPNSGVVDCSRVSAEGSAAGGDNPTNANRGEDPATQEPKPLPES